MLGQLPQPFAETLSTLRILAIADMGASAEIMRATAEACDADDKDGEPEGLEDIMVDEWDELRQLSCSRQTRWWRMEDSGAGGRKAIEVSEEEGERARALIEAPDWRADAGLEGRISRSADPLSSQCLPCTRSDRGFLDNVLIARSSCNGKPEYT